MQTPRKKQTLAGICILLLFAAFLLWAKLNRHIDAPPADSGYFTGAFRSKGDPNRCFDDTGKELPCPALPAVKIESKKSRPDAAKIDF